MHDTVYNLHFAFRNSPFGLTPDPDFLYLNANYREALASLTYALEARKGFVLVVGEAGTGKTTVLRKLLSELSPKIKTAYLFNTLGNFTDLLRLALADFGLQPSDNKSDMLAQLNEFLINEHNAGHIVALLIDEAQNLGREQLEELRTLTNLETAKAKLIQIALVGQPELEAVLSKTNLRQLDQRIGLRARLAPLPTGEIESYIEFRLKAAGHQTGKLFNRAAIKKIARYSHGIPRLINNLCDSALVVAYAAGKTKVDGKIIDEVATDLLPGSRRASKSEISPTKRQSVDSAQHFSDSVKRPWTHAAVKKLTYPLLRLFEIGRNYQLHRWLALSLLLIIAVLWTAGLFYSYQTISLPGSTAPNQITVAHGELTASSSLYGDRQRPGDVKPHWDSAGSRLIATSASPLGPLTREKVEPVARRTKRELILQGGFRDNWLQKELLGEYKIVANTFVRNRPVSHANEIVTLYPGTPINVTGMVDEFYVVESYGINAIRGYVHREDAFFERRN